MILVVYLKNYFMGKLGTLPISSLHLVMESFSFLAYEALVLALSSLVLEVTFVVVALWLVRRYIASWRELRGPLLFVPFVFLVLLWYVFLLASLDLRFSESSLPWETSYFVVVPYSLLGAPYLREVACLPSLGDAVLRSLSPFPSFLGIIRKLLRIALLLGLAFHLLCWLAVELFLLDRVSFLLVSLFVGYCSGCLYPYLKAYILRLPCRLLI